MICHVYIMAPLILVINLAGTFDVQPPKNVKVVKSQLQWKSTNDVSVQYFVQYKHKSEPADEWHNVSILNATKFEITNEFYGAIFRVRAEKEGHASEWRISNPVQCVNGNFCIPSMAVHVKPAMVQLFFSHMDQSLSKEYGAYITFNISHWKEVKGDHQEVEFNVTPKNNFNFNNLESGQKYCFQVQYLLYDRPYGNTSKQQCVNIPEGPEETKRRALITTVTVIVLVVSICGFCVFVLLKNRKKFKQMFGPPVNIPEHFQEFFFQEFPEKPCPSPSTESLRSCDIITFFENVNVEDIGQETQT